MEKNSRSAYSGVSTVVQHGWRMRMSNKGGGRGLITYLPLSYGWLLLTVSPCPVHRFAGLDRGLYGCEARDHKWHVRCRFLCTVSNEWGYIPKRWIGTPADGVTSSTVWYSIERFYENFASSLQIDLVREWLLRLFSQAQST